MMQISDIANISVYPTITPDVIVSWPRDCDYPLWRKFIRINRARFNKVIVVFTETNTGDDYRGFIKNTMLQDQVTFLENPVGFPGQDWRDTAVNWALDKSTSSWVWFTEQDFYILDERFWNEIYLRADSGLWEVLATAEGTRIHPSCIFMPRRSVERTSRNFAAKPPTHDHFGKIQKDIEVLKMNSLLLVDENRWGYKHYNGLSHNWRLASRGQEINYKPKEFVKYLEECLNLGADIEMDMRFVDVAKEIINANKREL